MTIDDIYREALKVRYDDSSIIVNGSTIAEYLDSPFNVYCQVFVSPEEQDPPNDYQKLLLARGIDHERQVLEQNYPEAQSVQEFASEEEGFYKTLELMAAGISVISGMPLVHSPSGMRGRPDLLIRDDSEPSLFGPYNYRVIEIKFAKNIRNAHMAQAAFYTRLLGHIQGLEPKTFSIINGEKETFSIPRNEYDGIVDQAIEGILHISSGEKIDPSYGSCKWPWKNYGESLAISQRSISLIPGVGPNLQASLCAAGLHTIDQLVETDPSELIKIKGVGQKTASRFLTRALAITTGKPVLRDAALKIPTHETGRGRISRSSYFDILTPTNEIFLDLEGTGFEEEGLPVTNYLIGAITRTQAQSGYQAFFAEKPEDEGLVLAAFCDYVASFEKCTIFHWGTYERTYLEKMMHHHELPTTIRELVLQQLVDLRPLLTQAFAFPTYKDGLKEIARYLGFEWQQEDVNALASIALYQEYLAGDTESKQRILTYNEDDCRATMVIKDWFLNQIDNR